jgi:hypothetical protein
MSNVVALDESGTYDCLLLSIGVSLMRGQYRRWVSAGGREQGGVNPSARSVKIGWAISKYVKIAAGTVNTVLSACT